MLKIVLAFLLLLSVSAKGQQPQLKSGLANFIKQNIIYPPYSLNNCIQGTVNIGFKLNAKGEVTDAKITKGFGIDLDDEALRLIKLTDKKWIIPKGFDTTSLVVMPVNFALKGYNCELKSANEIALAIKTYKDEEALIEVVTNFYRQKEKGIFQLDDELKVLRIKTDLGINDEYLDDVINTGFKKLKQGDRQGACEDFNFVKYMGSKKADQMLAKYCN
jgi:TonB family protein